MKENTRNSQCWVSNLIKFLVIALLCPLFSFSQTMDKQIQEFNDLNSKQKLTTVQIDRMTQICSEILEHDVDMAHKCLKKIKAAIDRNHDLEALSNYASILTRTYLFSENPVAGLTIVKKLYKKHEEELTNIQQIRILAAIIVFMDGMENVTESLPIIEETFQKLQDEPDGEVKTEYMATLYNARGNYFKTLKGDHKAAADDFLKALRLYKKSKNLRSIQNAAIIYNRLGLMYQDLKDYPKAIEYFSEGINEMEKTGTSWNLSNMYSSLGLIYKQTGSLQKALEYENKALAIAEKNNQQIDISRINSYLGNIYLEMKNYPKALEYTKLSLEFCQSFGIAEGIMQNFISLGNIYSETNQYKMAETAYDSATIYVNELKAPRVQVSLYQHYSNLYEKTGDYKKALLYHNKLYELEKQFFGQEKQQAIAEMEIQYQTELKDQQIANAAVEIKAKKAQNKILVIGIVAIVLIMGFVVFFLIYRNRILKDLYARNVELMNNFNQDSITGTENEIINNDDSNEEQTSLKSVFERLVLSLRDEKIYTDPELSLSKICEIVKSNEKYVSSAIANYAKTNYNNFINFYRINEAKRLIYETNNLNLNEVMYASGFNSRTTFYTAFKKHTGMSPKQFKEMS